MGVVLRRDYHAEKHGFTLIVMGFIGGLAGWVIGFIFLN